MTVIMADTEQRIIEGVTNAAGLATGGTLVDTDLINYYCPGLIGSTVIIFPADPIKRDVFRVLQAGGGVLVLSNNYRLGQIVANTPYTLLITRTADYSAERAMRNIGTFEFNTLFRDLASLLGNPATTFTAQLASLLASAASQDALLAASPEHMLEKTNGTCPNGDDDLFIVSGGPILVTNFFGLVTTVIGANAATCTIQHANTDPAADIALSTAVNIETDAVGTSYYITDAALGVFTPVTPGSIIQATQMLPWILQAGTLQATFSAANTGAIRWFLVYKKLSALSTVTMAP